MTTVKTAISIPESLFDRVNDLAVQLQIPRSQLFTLAVEEFIERHENCAILAALNEAYAEAADTDEEARRERMRRRQRRLLEGEW